MDVADQELLHLQRRDLYGTGAVREVRCNPVCGRRFLLTEEGWRGPWDESGHAVGDPDRLHSDVDFELVWGDCWHRIAKAWRGTAPEDQAADVVLPQEVADYLDHTRTHRVHVLQQALDPHQLAGPGNGTRILHQPEVDLIEEHFPRVFAEAGRYRVRVRVRVEVEAERLGD